MIFFCVTWLASGGFRFLCTEQAAYSKTEDSVWILSTGSPAPFVCIYYWGVNFKQNTGKVMCMSCHLPSVLLPFFCIMTEPVVSCAVCIHKRKLMICIFCRLIDEYWFCAGSSVFSSNNRLRCHGRRLVSHGMSVSCTSSPSFKKLCTLFSVSMTDTRKNGHFSLYRKLASYLPLSSSVSI